MLNNPLEGESMEVICIECGRKMKYINNRHLQSHNMTMEQYRQKFPNAKTMTDEVAKRLSDRSIKSNKNRIGKPRSETDMIAIRAGVAKRSSRKGIKVGPMAQEHRDKISVTKRRLYAEGVLTPYFLGRTRTLETRQKISIALTNRKVPLEIRQKRIVTLRAQGYDFGSTFRGHKHTVETKALIGTKSSAWQQSRRQSVRSVMFPRIKEAGLVLLNDVADNKFKLGCNVCGYEFIRNPQQFQPAKFHSDVCPQCYPWKSRSLEEIEVYDFVKDILPNKQIIINDREMISEDDSIRELDIFVPDFGIAIEYCGLYSHSELNNHGRWYHRTKLERCNKKDIRLITIFQDEWLNKKNLVKYMLKNAFHQIEQKIDARKCIIKEIPSEITNEFLNENHLQGRGRSNVRYGLYFNDELVSVMTFSDSEISRRLQGWEINRFCSKMGISVRGGASRLFSKFIQEHQPNKVTSYADLRWGTGDIYRILGFNYIGKTVPSYWYFQNNAVKRYHRYSLRKTKDEDVNISEWHLRRNAGWNRIWDCGAAKWIWPEKNT